jgi:hypothetical protein
MVALATDENRHGIAVYPLVANQREVLDVNDITTINGVGPNAKKLKYGLHRIAYRPLL